MLFAYSNQYILNFCCIQKCLFQKHSSNIFLFLKYTAKCRPCLRKPQLLKINPPEKPFQKDISQYLQKWFTDENDMKKQEKGKEILQGEEKQKELLKAQEALRNHFKTKSQLLQKDGSAHQGMHQIRLHTLYR